MGRVRVKWMRRWKVENIESEKSVAFQHQAESGGVSWVDLWDIRTLKWVLDKGMILRCQNNVEQ